ncbi:hypothetical protein AMTRI_Chr06g191370 [Amborella trichopoda]|uniref:DUF4228 domain-containing protein n=1 Tax=Amborella trichopoda TaxID=13333 RepID=W1P911_AMBTC|nr:uncharacterized protein LOC18434561 [Amborella trichopoda]ERN06367.1 hypothetical protein AMTR_s00016p00245800 [Amborella trichopoda]|eukprot:XP_006844692.1 uncharacterized protein LOC18434561 [Amborella trichopoda]
MGIKFMKFHMLPWCFQMMGSHISCVQFPTKPPLGTVKLIQSDGVVKIYHKPVHASDLMLQFPKHLICDGDSFFIGQKIPALSEKDELKLGHKYFLLPKHFFQSVLSFVSLASFASDQISPSPSGSSPDLMARRKTFVKKAANCRPFDIHKAPNGGLQIRVSDEFIAKLMESGSNGEEEERFRGKVCTSRELQKDYMQLVRSRPWRPKLETIKESDRERKRLVGSFGIRRRKKTQQRGPGKKLQRS